MAKTKPITLKNVRQTPAFCGPASLESLLHYYGVKKTERELIRLCRATQEEGTDHAPMVEALRKLKLHPRAGRHGTWQELKRLTDHGIPVLIGWYSHYVPPASDHYSVVFRVTEKSIHLMDPERGGVRRMSRGNFMLHWYDFSTPQNTLVKRWYLYLADPVPKRKENPLGALPRRIGNNLKIFSDFVFRHRVRHA